jgi:hypothetical protein
VVIDKVDEALPLAGGVTDVGFKLQVIVPFGEEQVSPVAELKLFTEVNVNVEVVEAPTLIIADPGERPMLKSAAAVTVIL